MEGKFKLSFPHCWSVKHFLLENGSYFYGEEEFTVEDSFQKKKLLDIFNCLVYVMGAIPSGEAKMCHKHLIYISLLMGAHSRKDH